MNKDLQLLVQSTSAVIDDACDHLLGPSLINFYNALNKEIEKKLEPLEEPQIRPSLIIETKTRFIGSDYITRYLTDSQESDKVYLAVFLDGPQQRKHLISMELTKTEFPVMATQFHEKIQEFGETLILAWLKKNS